jgi:hypothetical protein
MGAFNEKSNNDIAIIYEKENFLNVLESLHKLLKDSENFHQAQIINNLITLINQNNIPQFLKSINGLDMWGGGRCCLGSIY